MWKTKLKEEEIIPTILLPQNLTIELDQIDIGSPISKNEIDLILSNLRRKKFAHYIMVKFLFLTGATLSELTNLRIANVTTNKSRCLIVPNEKLKQRVIHFDEGFAKELDRYIFNYPKNEFLFPGRNGKCSLRSLQKILKEVGNWISKEINGNQIRDFIAHHLYQRGFPIWEIQEFLGHRSALSTKERIQTVLPTVEFDPLRLFTSPENKAA